MLKSIYQDNLRTAHNPKPLAFWRAAQDSSRLALAFELRDINMRINYRRVVPLLRSAVNDSRGHQLG